MLNNSQKQWEFLKIIFESGQLAHAYLFSGQDVDSIKLFAKEFAKLVNCLYYKLHDREICSISSSGEICQNCRMIEAGGFPDLLVVKSINSKRSVEEGKDMMEITIEQIRDLQNFLSYKPYYGDFKISVIEDTERMSVEAQNCFLKSLEEPKGRTLIILISSKPDLLLPTIFSRCQQIKFFSQGKHQILQEEQGIMQELLKVINSDLAERFQYCKKTNLEDENFNKILNILQKYFRDLLLWRVGVIPKAQLIDSKSLTIGQLKKIIELIERINYQTNISNINPKLALEIVLMEV